MQQTRIRQGQNHGAQDDFAALKADLIALREHARSGAGHAIEHGKDRMRAAKDSVVGAARKATDSSRAYIETHPFRSVGMALGLGAVAGAILALKLRRR